MDRISNLTYLISFKNCLKPILLNWPSSLWRQILSVYDSFSLLNKYLGLQLWGYKKLRDEDSYQESDNKNFSAKLWIAPDEYNKFYLLASLAQILLNDMVIFIIKTLPIL